ncbi:MAG: hypothetical protein ACTSSJ_06780, partial [Candidatus Odinarchaeia archaeon]
MSVKRNKVLAIGLLAFFAFSMVAVTGVQARLSFLPDETPYIGHSFTEEAWSAKVDWVPIIVDALTQFNDTIKTNPSFSSMIQFLPPIPEQVETSHIWTFHAYVNKYNYMMFYSGFEGFSLNLTGLMGSGEVIINGTVPMQTILQRYKTPTGKEVYSLQTFLMVVAF